MSVFALPSSPRRRRRLAWAGAGVAVAALAAAGVAALPSGKPAAPAEPLSNEPAQLPPRERPLRLSRADRQAVNAVLDRFVPAAVERRDGAAAYDLVTARLRGDDRREAWARGALPVMQVPARGARFHDWLLKYVDENAVGFDLLLQPKPKARIGPIMFAVDLRRIRGRWLVDSFGPIATFAPANAPARVRAVGDFSPQAGGSEVEKGRLSPVWLLLPVSFLGLLAVLGLAWVLVSRRRAAA
jgi:hypothetical protein